jgi:hypothetical protein
MSLVISYFRCTVPATDLNGASHECVAEAFDTTYNVIILLYPVRTLTRTTIILPPGTETIRASL